MFRQHISAAGGQTFFAKLRNGIETLDVEVQKLTHVAGELEKDPKGTTLPRSYFQEASLWLDDIGTVYDETLGLYNEVNENPITLDDIETRLQSLRQRLIEFEEKPEVIKSGYQRFVPRDYVPPTRLNMDDVEEGDGEEEEELRDNNNGMNGHLHSNGISNGHCDFDLPDSNGTPAKTPKAKEGKSQNQQHNLQQPSQSPVEEMVESFNILTTLTKSVKKKKPVEVSNATNVIKQPSLARAAAILNKWRANKEDQPSSPSYSYSTSCTDFPRQTRATPEVKMNPLFSKLSPEVSSVRTRSAKKKSNHSIFAAPKPLVAPVSQSNHFASSHKKTRPQSSRSKPLFEEYETVEFTPGMTTKIPTPMAPPKAKAAAPAAVAQKKRQSLPRNVKKLLSHRTTRHLWAKAKRTAAKQKVTPEKVLARKPKFVVKKIGGEKNGGERKVLVKKGANYYPTEPAFGKRKSGKTPFKAHKRTLKAGIEPGRVLIVLAGRHRGKRVVFLKQLPSGLLLVNGPFTVNQCPLRRMHQQYVIVTSTKLDISSVKVPAHIDDRYFKARREKKTKKADGSEVFAQEKKQWKPDAQRKTDQKEVDTQLLDVIRKQPEKKLLFSYLGSYFQLRNRMYPHKLKY